MITWKENIQDKELKELVDDTYKDDSKALQDQITKNSLMDGFKEEKIDEIYSRVTSQFLLAEQDMVKVLRKVDRLSKVIEQQQAQIKDLEGKLKEEQTSKAQTSSDFSC